MFRIRIATLALAALAAWAAPVAVPAQDQPAPGTVASKEEAIPSAAGRDAPRNAAEERFFLTPSARLLEPWTVVLSDDEVVVAHLGVGVSRWLQLDLELGALPVPGAGGIATPEIIIGAAGVAVLGLASVGAKLRVIEEGAWGEWVPGLAAGYDLVDLFGGGIGGVVILGHGIGAAGALGAANLQLNLFSFTLGKHIGERFRAGGGTFVVDNHHLLPQVAGFTAVDTAGDTAGGSATIDHLPTALIPFVNGECWLGGGFSTIAEVFPRKRPFGTVGLRWVSGRGRRDGLARWLRAKIDVAALWNDGSWSDRHGRSLPVLPWLGVGLYLG